MSKTLREVFGHWQAHDVAAHNERVAKRLRTGAADNPGQDNAPPEVRSRSPLESDLHDEILDWCRARGYLVVHSRMDRKTTQAKGVSDFIIVTPKTVVFCEAKRKGNKLTPEQRAFLAHASKLGWPNFVVYSIKEFSAYMEMACN